MPVRSTKAAPFSSPLDNIQFKALSIPATAHRRPVVNALGEVRDRIRGEFIEMRGFSPTVEQAARLFQINRDDCVRVLKSLVDEGFIRQTPDGRYRLPPQQ